MNTNIPHQQQARQQQPAHFAQTYPQSGATGSRFGTPERPRFGTFLSQYRSTLTKGETLEEDGYKLASVLRGDKPCPWLCDVIGGNETYRVDLFSGTCTCRFFRRTKSEAAVSLCKHLVGASLRARRKATEHHVKDSDIPVWLRARERQIECAWKWLLEREKGVPTMVLDGPTTPPRDHVAYAQQLSRDFD
jgi:hypothetical protein